MNSEILIIGGGVIGLSIARELYKKGARRITIVDRGTIGAEASWAAAGMLAPNIETDTSDDFHRFGIESLELYPDLSEALIEETGIDIELDRSGTLNVAFDEAEAADLGETYQQQILRRVPVEHLSGESVQSIEPSISLAACAALCVFTIPLRSGDAAPILDESFARPATRWQCARRAPPQRHRCSD